MRADRRELAAVFVGGCAGTVARALLGEAIPRDPAAWPWATFLVNVGGTFLLGWLITGLERRPPPSPYRRPLLGTGLCGALTTFSAFQLELLEMLDADRVALAAAYAGASLAAGYAAVALATRLVRRGGASA